MFFKRKKKEEIIEVKPIEKKEEKLPEVITAEVVEEEIGEEWKKQSSKSLDEIERKIDRMDSKAEWKLKKRFETKFGEKLETPTEAVLKEKEEIRVEVPKIRKEKVSKKKVEEAFEVQLGIKKEEPKVIVKEEKIEVKPKIETKEDEQKVKFKKVEEVKIPTEEEEEVEGEEEKLELPKEVPTVQKPIKEKKWYNIRQLYLTRKKQPKGAKKIVFMIIDIVLWFVLLPFRILYLPIRFLKKRKAKKMGISEEIQSNQIQEDAQISQQEGVPQQEGISVQPKEKKWYNFRQLYLTRKKQPKGAKKIAFMIIDVFLWIILLIPRIFIGLPIRFLKKRKANKMAKS